MEGSDSTGHWKRAVPASEVTWDRRFAPDFQKRVLERAYFQYVSGVSEDEILNYYEALRIELTHTP